VRDLLERAEEQFAPRAFSPSSYPPESCIKALRNVHLSEGSDNSDPGFLADNPTTVSGFSPRADGLTPD
jgi:hypothetical protein